MGSFVAKDVALLLHTPPSSALCLVTRVLEHACILSWHCSVASAQVIRRFSFVYTYYCFLFVFWNNAVQTRMFETVRHCQVEMFVSVYANVHYHRYLGPRPCCCSPPPSHRGCPTVTCAGSSALISTRTSFTLGQIIIHQHRTPVSDPATESLA